MVADKSYCMCHSLRCNGCCHNRFQMGYSFT
jgi:hypothetical protein